MKYCLLLIFIFICFGSPGQELAGRVFDGRTRDAVPFATVRFGDSGKGMVADLDGKFTIPQGSGITWLEVSCLGYKTRRIMLPARDLNIYLEPEAGTLDEAVVKPPYEKIRRIINNAITHKSDNNPDKYDWYRCNVYYKMVVDAVFPDSIVSYTSKSRDIKDFFDKQHLLMSETYSKRTWQRPEQLQEQVLASRFSGLKKSVFTSLVTDIQPFHAYSDYIKLNGKDHHNPISGGYEQYYKFNLNDEIVQGNDTVWVLSFSPRGSRTNDLKGKVYINSDGYAISQIVARASDTMLKLNVRIEQQYERVVVNDSVYRWFPTHLNYVLEWEQKSGKTAATIRMKGNSRIDSVSFKKDDDFHFDKAHTIKLADGAAELTDVQWKNVRPDTLTAKETETYRVIDSFGEKIHADQIMRYLSKLPESKIPIGPFDFDIRRFISTNKYEHTRLGLGLQTNEKVIRWLSVGGWAGYGFGDKQWKYGAFAEIYADKYREFVFRAGYNNDINEPGRVHINRDMDRVYLKYLLLSRVDETKEYFASVKKKTGYWNWELNVAKQKITPKYAYAFSDKGRDFTTYNATEASLSFRYAFAERTVPFFNSYTRGGTKYPIWYGKLTAGNLEAGNTLIPYTQALTAIVWHKHINRIGMEHIILEGGKSWSDNALPLSKLFAGNGFKYDNKSNVGIYTLGGMMTMYPYAYYTDQFVNLIFRHDFDRKLFKLESRELVESSSPYIALQYNLLYGTLAHPEAQKYAAFSVPATGYHEVGILLNNLLRLRFLNLYYLTMNMGYFYHITTSSFSDKEGRFVYGFGIEL